MPLTTLQRYCYIFLQVLLVHLAPHNHLKNTFPGAVKLICIWVCHTHPGLLWFYFSDLHLATSIFWRTKAICFLFFFFLNTTQVQPHIILFGFTFFFWQKKFPSLNFLNLHIKIMMQRTEHAGEYWFSMTSARAMFYNFSFELWIKN